MKVFGKCMSVLYSNFQGYLQFNIPRIKWVVLFGFFFFAIYYFILIKGYARKYQNKRLTVVCGCMLSMNFSFVFVMTLFGRKKEELQRFELIPFESYIKVFKEENMEYMLQIVMNIAMYIPLGFLLPCCFKAFKKYRYTIFVAFISSLCIELIQIIFKMGLFEVDDIINNTMGCAIGVSLYMLILKLQNIWYKNHIS